MGIAYLPDGSTMDYDEYIRSHPHWKLVRRSRYDFDDGKCAICHQPLGFDYQTHHLDYTRLGHERLRDVISLCTNCHRTFHNNWQKQVYWRGKESGHWDTFDLPHTAMMCAMYYQDDRFISRDITNPNLCNRDTDRLYVSQYLKQMSLPGTIMIDPNDLLLFVRNKRYELYFEAESRGLSVGEFLDEYYGQKIKGSNPLRQEAGKKGGTFDHTPESFHRHYRENPNLNKLMEEVKKYE